uniref:F-box-like protein n=1 Tax=Camellia sinensis TaxID=4442 RepID=A0A5P9VJY0_CAMSI|nr:F-box-like protein [Camellia sinensis]
MALELLLHGHYQQFSIPTIHSPPPPHLSPPFLKNEIGGFRRRTKAVLRWRRQKPPLLRHRVITAALPQLDLTEDNVKQVLVDARAEFGQIFDSSVGITGKAELAELDGPFVKISLKGRFWHKRSTVLDRLANYLKQRIPEILEVDIEDEKQLDDSPANF